MLFLGAARTAVDFFAVDFFAVLEVVFFADEAVLEAFFAVAGAVFLAAPNPGSARHNTTTSAAGIRKLYISERICYHAKVGL